MFKTTHLHPSIDDFPIVKQCSFPHLCSFSRLYRNPFNIQPRRSVILASQFGYRLPCAWSQRLSAVTENLRAPWLQKDILIISDMFQCRLHPMLEAIINNEMLELQTLNLFVDLPKQEGKGSVSRLNSWLYGRMMCKIREMTTMNTHMITYVSPCIPPT